MAAAAADDLNSLRARVVALNGPPGATLAVAQEYLRFADASAPKFVDNGGLEEECDDSVDDTPAHDEDGL